jgi:hypothetical protein
LRKTRGRFAGISPQAWKPVSARRGRAPGRGLFCYESLEAATDRRRVWADSGWHGCTHLFYHLPAKIVWVGGKAFLPGLAFTEF